MYMVYTGAGSASCKILGGRLPQNRVFFKTGRGGGFFSQKMIVRTCGETHSVIDSMLAYMAQYALQAKMIFLIYHITITYWQLKMQPGTSAKSHWINYILLWKNEIYSGKTPGKHLEKRS